jgi:F0F1-type ATP synthase assembly protein I
MKVSMKLFGGIVVGMSFGLVLMYPLQASILFCLATSLVLLQEGE